MRLKIAPLIVSFSLILQMSFPVSAAANDLTACRIKESQNQIVSLGFPVAKERLKYKNNPKIMVLPFRLSDIYTFQFTQDVKLDYIQAGKYIERYSNGLTKPDFVFNSVISVPETVSDMVTLRDNQLRGWKDESRSTWGFVRKLIEKNDSSIDFSGIDAVILHGSSDSISSSIAEAMMFRKNSPDPYFRPIATDEYEIFNAVLLDKAKNVTTIAHEIMHLYGLTDLYGSATGPSYLSLMAAEQDTLLTYEKWILGWIPDTQVQCVIEVTDIDRNKVSTSIKIPKEPNDQLVVINSNDLYSALIIETTTIQDSKYLAFYSLNNELRPPIFMHFPLLPFPPTPGLTISKFEGVSAILVSPNYQLLVSDSTETELVLDLIPTSQVINASSLIAQAKANQLRIEQAAKATKPVVIKPTKGKKTIICLKGKVARKVTAINPTCPTGFKKR